jgi:hypothetical protein
MSEPGTTLRPTADASTDEPWLLELVGLAAYVELGTFGLFASHSAHAPDLARRQVLAEVADRVLRRQRGLLEIAQARGVESVDLMSPFDGVLADFDARTVPHSWWEGLLKGIVGHGVAEDLCRILANGLSGPDAATVLAVVERPRDDGAATVMLAEAVKRDDVLAARLALWGRRVVGEALRLAQTVLSKHPVFATMARAAGSAVSGGAATGAAAERGTEVPAWLLAQLTAEHTRRMDRIGLAA